MHTSKMTAPTMLLSHAFTYINACNNNKMEMSVTYMIYRLTP